MKELAQVTFAVFLIMFAAGACSVRFQVCRSGGDIEVGFGRGCLD